jgi:hypothetical protein
MLLYAQSDSDELTWQRAQGFRKLDGDRSVIVLPGGNDILSVQPNGAEESRPNDGQHDGPFEVGHLVGDKWMLYYDHDDAECQFVYFTVESKS